ncbi:MAG TPA: L-glutamate gamma-semialdehyde dehydrogenase [Kofleriaceae bacterium]|nr:L-glutamate gamma-semialdehyde dehydrogenase [Kofleriaceae bacterium]
MNAIASVPTPRNEPVLDYAPGSPERARLEAELARIAGEQIEIPCIIAGQRVHTGRLKPVVMPHDHGHVLARFHAAGPAEIEQAAVAANAAWRDWQAMRWESRAAVFLRAAELIAGPRRMTLNASTMLGQSKTSHQAEIDSACELIDFLRFNVGFASRLYAEQPESSPGVWNQVELRPLEGFVLALTPFNFTAIAGNLPGAPALMGNVVLWKPAESQMLAAYYIYMVLEEAGLPPGVINFLPGSGAELVPIALDRPDFAGLHFTGSTDVFRDLWRRTGENLSRYRNYPRLVGETGGKDFILAHPSAADDVDALVTAIVRGGYEYQGQKCSAASRVYVPESVWRRIKAPLCDTISSLRMGDVRDFKNFMGAVIKKSAFDKHAAAIAESRKATGARVLAGGETDDSKGWFVRPTLIQAEDPDWRTMRDELFGPIVTVHVYPDAKWNETLTLVDRTSPYALTGAVFSRDRTAIEEALVSLSHAAGNFYINDKPTGAVVGQQPFGGARASGTDDKAGSAQNLLRWVAARTIKETFVPAVDYRYPYMG